MDGPASEQLGLLQKPSEFTTAAIELAASLGANKMQLQGMHILVYFNGAYWKKGQPGVALGARLRRAWGPPVF